MKACIAGAGAIAVLTLAFAPVTRAMPGVRLAPAGDAACRPPASRCEGAEGTAFVHPRRASRPSLSASPPRRSADAFARYDLSDARFRFVITPRS